MSKRHKKTKEFMSSQNGGDIDQYNFDTSELYQAPKGKLRGHDRRKSIKRAFYDH